MQTAALLLALALLAMASSVCHAILSEGFYPIHPSSCCTLSRDSKRYQHFQINFLALGSFVTVLGMCVGPGVALLQVQQESGLSANWRTGQDPCALPLWDAVNCSTDGHVTTL